MSILAVLIAEQGGDTLTTTEAIASAQQSIS